MAGLVRSKETYHGWTDNLTIHSCNIELGCTNSSQEEFLGSEEAWGTVQLGKTVEPQANNVK